MSDYEGTLHRGFDLVKFIDRLMEGGGWDDPDELEHSLADCDGKIRGFLLAVAALRERLERTDGLLFDTDEQIEALARDYDSPWARYVDPRMSRARLHPTNGALIVLFECWDHIVALHDVGGERLKVIKDREIIEDLRKSATSESLTDELDDDLDGLEEELDELHEEGGPEADLLPNISVDLNAEDLERRQLLSAERLSQLEPVTDSGEAVATSHDSEFD